MKRTSRERGRGVRARIHAFAVATLALVLASASPAQSRSWLRATPAGLLALARVIDVLAPTIAALSTDGEPSALDPQSADPAPPDEKLEKVDPYTRGQREELDRAGYVSLDPHRFAQGIQTRDIEETFGSLPVLWVETAHFELGSTLGTYRCPTDDHEQQKLRDELGRLAKKLPRVRRDSTKLDPWLRLHLYAQRLEEQYADFEARFGVRDEDFASKVIPDATTPVSMGPGPFLGQEMKFTVLLTSKSSQVARFAKRWLASDEKSYYRGLLPGGSWFFGTSAQTAKALGTDLDSALHALVAGELTYNLCDGFRGARYERPLWFKHGLGLYYARNIDERWCIHVLRNSTENEDDSWRWEPRIHGLVSNSYVTKWDEMLEWQDHAKLEPQQHMTAWSRVAWLMSLEKADLHAFIMAMSEPVISHVFDAERPLNLLEQQKKALHAAFGKTPAELDEAWRKWVLKKYPKK